MAITKASIIIAIPESIPVLLMERGRITQLGLRIENRRENVMRRREPRFIGPNVRDRQLLRVESRGDPK